ncbi:hypothetical protein POM88_000011 [Heracleum sosnowskyi]|uniref:GB1/RHD3-type G domain-containing protein n=1 Tax=Heracleum sosnowskyi TaxID=360622 RepID=A0AAD8JD39_9APIA|nr:hypothetical protein POM88_000011 [Heracleum sosnowskyi]
MRCCCPTDEVVKRALKAGLQSSQIKVYGLPVRPSFVMAVCPKDELRKYLGMDEDLPAVLLMGDGEGMSPIETTARALGSSLFQFRLRDLSLKRRNAWRLVNCDCIITKAGPGTIAEAMIRGLPIILSGFIAGQVGSLAEAQARTHRRLLPKPPPYSPYTATLPVPSGPPRAIRLVYCDENGEFKMDLEAVAVLQLLKEPVGVVSVCGRARQGKSFILNQIRETCKASGSGSETARV